MNKIRVFGHVLGLENAVIENIIAEHANDGYTVIAHAVFVKWKLCCKDLDGMTETLENAFNELNRDTDMHPSELILLS